MTLLERIKYLAKKKGISLRQVADDLDFGETYLYQLKTKKPNAQTLEKIADYFHVSVDYLLGREEAQEPQPVDLKNLIENDGIDWNEWVSFDGKPITEHDKEMIKAFFGNRLKD